MIFGSLRFLEDSSSALERLGGGNSLFSLNFLDSSRVLDFLGTGSSLETSFLGSSDSLRDSFLEERFLF